MILYLIYSTIILLIISKFFDCFTTSQYLKNATVETNPLAKYFMIKFGFKNTTWIIFLLSVLIIITSSYPAIIYSDILYRIFFILIGLIISIIQFAVAHHNYSGKKNIITKKVWKLHIILKGMLKR